MSDRPRCAVCELAGPLNNEGLCITPPACASVPLDEDDMGHFDCYICDVVRYRAARSEALP
jgi:hypothetical protein